jgi:OmpA-OmpF porin, OOP family
MAVRLVLLSGAAVLAAMPAVSAGELRGTYFALEGGASWVQSESLTQRLAFTTGATTSSQLQGEFDAGWVILGSIGYAFDNHLRVEIEGGYRVNDLDQLLTIGGTPIASTGDLSEFTLMANLLYDFRLGDRLTASVGGGVGADLASLEAGVFGLDESEWGFGFQGLLGLNYVVGERTQVFINYRYLRVEGPEFSNAVAGPPAAQLVSFRGDLDKHAVTLGVRLALEGQAAPLPPPAPSPPPPPPAPVIPRQFIVFFGFDSHDLTNEARRVVGDAADAARRAGAASIAIIGHTDSSGSTTYNRRLSERRASAVRKELISLGFAAANMSTAGHGEDELIVKTADDVKEPQNRRATIDLE